MFTHSNDASAHRSLRRDYFVDFECFGHKMSVYRVVVYDKRLNTYLLLCPKKNNSVIFPFYFVQNISTRAHDDCWFLKYNNIIYALEFDTYIYIYIEWNKIILMVFYFYNAHKNGWLFDRYYSNNLLLKILVML